MGTATLTTTAVTAGKDSATGLYRLDPPFAGDDGALHEYGAAMVAPYSGFVDVFAADSDGHIVLDSDGEWVSLINCSPLDGGWAALEGWAHGAPTVESEFAASGYTVVQ